ncbi:MAG: hypothetical protein IJB96_07265 [Lachnospira sp.]|nr:hypothetical protein [Lachnospira sp.]
MKKDIIKALIALSICIVVIAAICIGYSVYTRRNEAKDYTAVCEKYGYVAYWDEKDGDDGNVLLIHTYDEYKQWVEKILNGGSTSKSYKEKLESYDEAFFAENDLIMKYFTLNSGSITLKFNRLDVIDGVGYVRTERKVPMGAVTDDMAYWAVFVEVSKDEGITSVGE